jgi:broad specificity phosphatase PhoE
MGKGQGLPIADALAFKSSSEKLADFQRRVMTWWKSIIQQMTSLDTRSNAYHLLVVAHGRFLHDLVTKLVKAGHEENATVVLGTRSCFNCSVTVMEVEKMGAVKVIKYGDIEHLNKEHLAQGVVKINADQAGGESG